MAAIDTSTSTEYRPYLDGMRAIAVYLVVGFHAGLSRLVGGFVGVDVFFVLSGFLVTRLLMVDLIDGSGRIRFGRFYSRRARRLLPAAALQLMVTAVVFTSIGSTVDIAAASDAMRAAAVYLANWHFIGQSTDYFAESIESSPVLHYWSLSVEEQFYLLWPLVLTGIYAATRRFGSRQWRAIRGAVLVLGIASLVRALQLAAPELERAYYGTDTRSYQLLAGASLALAPGLVRRVGARLPGWMCSAGSALMLAVIGLTATSLLDLNAIHRGVITTVAMVAGLLFLEASPKSLTARVLGWSPLVFLGRISYGTYLWHWLVVVVLEREAELSSRTTAVLAAVLASGIAALSYQLLEQPIRTAPVLDRHRAPVALSGLALSVLVALVAIPLITDSGDDQARVEIGKAHGVPVVTAIPDKAILDAAYNSTFDYDGCDAGGGQSCHLRAGTGQTAIIIGESHAGMLTPMLVELAERHDLDLHGAYLPYCPWTRGVKYANVAPTCHSAQIAVFAEAVVDLDPDIVFLAHRSVDDSNDPLQLRVVDEQGRHLPGNAREALASSVRGVVDELRSDGRSVVLFEPVPVAPSGFSPLRCLGQAAAVEACRFVAGGPLEEESVMRELAADDTGVVSVDLDRLVCPYYPICDPVLDGRVVQRDTNHLTLTFAQTLLDPVDDYLTATGALDSEPAMVGG